MTRGGGPATARIQDVDLAGLRTLWKRTPSTLPWPCLFTLPPWLEAWLTTLGRGACSYLQVVFLGEEPVGFSPLLRYGQRATFCGDPEIFDYQDLVLAPGAEAAALAALWDAWRDAGVAVLDLRRLRPDALVLRYLVPFAEGRGAQVSVTPDGASVEVALPGSWEEYLARLEKKQRHELRRKLRRLYAGGEVSYRAVRRREEAAGVAGEFLHLFRDNRADKAAFLNPEMEAYFGALLSTNAREGLLNLGLLTCGGTLAAAALCFDHCGRTHLYNNGYRQRFAPLSVGLLSKVLSLRESLERGMAVYDLLAGEEAYKFHLGGRAVPLCRCEIRL